MQYIKISLKSVPLLMAVTFVSFLLLPQISLAGEREDQIAQIEAEAKDLSPVQTSGSTYEYPSIDELFQNFSLTYTRDESLEQDLGESLLKQVYSERNLSEYGDLERSGVFPAMVFYVTYDAGTSAALGAGERAGSFASWRAAQLVVRDDGYTPGSEAQWQDILKIANGRWPENIRRTDVEELKYDEFRTIYNREPDRANPNDDAAIMTMTYGLRPQPRNIDSEATAVGFFKGIYDRDPSSTADWDIVRAIAYSGATR